MTKKNSTQNAHQRSLFSDTGDFIAFAPSETHSPNSPETRHTSDDKYAEPYIRAHLETMTTQELASQIHYHNARYNEGSPVISDPLFDELVEKLRGLSPNDPTLDELTTPSVSQASTHKIPHAVPMLSLEKLKKGEEFKSIELWLKSFSGDFLGSPKIDGLACSLSYDANGRLSLASTRGDGMLGENITPNVLHIDAIPKQIDTPNLEVRGEVYMPLTAFRQFEGDKISARNLAVGGLKQKDAAETAKYRLNFFAYEAIGIPFKTDAQKFEKLRSLGFQTIDTHRFKWDETRRLKDLLAEIDAYCREMAIQRANWNFDADGLVFKIDDNDTQKALGFTAHHPRCAVAYKFECDNAKTILRDVLWQVAKGGTLTPVAVFDPVELAGALVQRATLSNAEQVEAFPICPASIATQKNALPSTSQPEWNVTHLQLGDEILVSRRGDVIPHVEFVVSHPDNAQEIHVPTTCTSCGSPLLRDGKFLRCTTPDTCPTTGQALIENYVKVTGMLGFGSKIIASLYDENLINDPADLYKLDLQQIARAVRSADDSKFDPNAKLPSKLLRSIQSKRILPYATFLEALSIPALGKVNSSLLAASHLDIHQLLRADEQTLAQCLNGRELTAQKIFSSLQKKEGLIEELLNFVQIDYNDPEHHSKNGPFQGMSFLFTGSLHSMKRDEAQKRVEALGAKAASGVSKTLSVLVSTTEKTSKWAKAEALNASGAHIQLWTEEEFLQRLTEAEQKSPAP